MRSVIQNITLLSFPNARHCKEYVYTIFISEKQEGRRSLSAEQAGNLKLNSYKAYMVLILIGKTLFSFSQNNTACYQMMHNAYTNFSNQFNKQPDKDHLHCIQYTLITCSEEAGKMDTSVGKIDMIIGNEQVYVKNDLIQYYIDPQVNWVVIPEQKTIYKNKLNKKNIQTFSFNMIDTFFNNATLTNCGEPDEKGVYRNFTFDVSQLLQQKYSVKQVTFILNKEMQITDIIQSLNKNSRQVISIAMHIEKTYFNTTSEQLKLAASMNPFKNEARLKKSFPGYQIIENNSIP